MTMTMIGVMLIAGLIALVALLIARREAARLAAQVKNKDNQERQTDLVYAGIYRYIQHRKYLIYKMSASRGRRNVYVC